VTIQFLWRFLALSGTQPDVERCDSCGITLGEAAAGLLDPRSGSILCEACSPPGATVLAAGARRYLGACAALPLAEACALRLDSRALASMQETLLAVVRTVLESDLATVRCLGAVP
jgi:recombinational DNA repair protein (RecF pathway)